MASGSRQVVDIDNPNLLIAESRRNPYVPDKVLKAKVLSALCHIHEQAAQQFQVLGELNNLTVASQLTNHLLTMHHSLLQKENAKGGGKIFDKVQPALIIHYGATNKEVASESLMEMVRSVFQAYGLTYQHVAGKPPS